MINEEKVKIMTKLAMYEQGKGRKYLPVSRYYRSDYIGLALIKNFFLVTIGYVLIVAAVAVYFGEYLLENIHRMNLVTLGIYLIVGYVIVLAAYSILTYIQYSVKYYQAKKSVREYYSQLTELNKIYAREENVRQRNSRRLSEMTALLEFKQKIKGLFAQYEVYVMPLLKFILALVYFIWINSNMGYMRALDNIFIVLILALICSVLPTGMIIFAGCAMMVAHCYALGIEVAGFMLVILLFMLILFLRFSAGKNIVMVFTPLAFAFDLPALLPIGCGLLSSPVSALPASGGVIIYYFIRYVRIQSQVLMSQDTQMIDKLTLLSDGIMKNGEMWLTLITFVVVILAVQLIRTRQFDYAWRIAIIAGGVIYLVLMLAGSMYFGLSVPIATQIVFTVVAVLLGIVLEFFVFGGDYTRTERLEYEDDDYYYYVKAVPKALVATSERSIKKINGEPMRDEKKQTERVVNFSAPLFQGVVPPEQPKAEQDPAENTAAIEKADLDDIDFEKKLEESLKDL